MNHWPQRLVRPFFLLLCISMPFTIASAVADFDRATRLVMAGDYDGACKEYESFLQRAPNDRLSPAAAMAIANINLDARRDSAAAIPWLDRVVKDFPASSWAPEAARAKGRCMESQKMWAEAGETYMQAIELAAKNREAFSDQWMNDVTLSAANSFFAANDRPKQIETYRRVLDGSPPPEVAATSLFRLGESYEQEGDIKSAAESYARIVQEHPASPMFDSAMRKRPLIEKSVSLDWGPFEKYAEGGALVRQQDFPGAMRNTDELLAVDTSPAIRECLEYRKITLETAQAGDYTEGCRKLREYIERYPNGQRTSLARRTLEQNWGPIADLERATQEDPNNAEAWGNLGMACLQARAGAKATVALEKALALDPENAETHLGLGYAYSMTRRNDEAAKSFEFYLQQNPNDETALNMIGYSYLGLGQADKAIPYFERYAKLAPEDPNSHDSLGEGYLTAGRLDEAAKEYERAIEINPTFANSQFMLGHVYQQMGNKEKATAAYRRFLELSSGGPQADEARSAIESLSKP